MTVTPTPDPNATDVEPAGDPLDANDPGDLSGTVNGPDPQHVPVVEDAGDTPTKPVDDGIVGDGTHANPLPEV